MEVRERNKDLGFGVFALESLIVLQKKGDRPDRCIYNMELGNSLNICQEYRE